MNRKLAERIVELVNGSPYATLPKPLFRAALHEGTFTEVSITVFNDDNAHSAALLRALPELGMMYGETLFIERKLKRVRVN